MFTLQVSAAANQMLQAGMPSQVVDVLMNTLGNCRQTLVHRGPLTVSAELPDATYTVGDTAVPDAQNGESYPAASVTFIGGGTYDENTNKVNGGFAGGFHGPVFFGGPIVFGGAFVFPGGAAGLTTTVQVLTNIVANSDSFTLHYKTLTFTKGVLTGVTTDATGTIEGEACA